MGMMHKGYSLPILLDSPVLPWHLPLFLSCSSIPDVFVQASTGMWGCAPNVVSSSAVEVTVPTGALPVVSYVDKEEEGLSCCCPQQYILLFTAEIGLHLFSGLQMLVESEAGEEVALLQASYPCARWAHGFTITGNSSGGNGGHGWLILGSAVPHTLPSAVRTAAMHGDKVPFEHCAYTMQMKKWSVIMQSIFCNRNALQCCGLKFELAWVVEWIIQSISF